MKLNRIGNSEIHVSEISLGCWTMGGLNWVNGTPNGWANVDEDEVVRAIKAAIDAGVNHFDNADVYGNGKAERMLARAFRKLGLRSADYVVATKIGHFPGTAEHAYEPAHIRHQCEQSLINLQRDHIDIYYLHHGNFGENDRYLEGAAETLDALVAEGKIRVKGQSAYSAADFAKAIPVVRPEVLQSWSHAMDPQFILPDSPVGKLMAERNLSFVAFSPLNQGLLLDKFDPENPPAFDEGDHRRNAKKFTRESLLAVRAKMARIKERFGGETETLAGVALRYVLAHPHVACVIPGFRNEKQVACNLSAAGYDLSADDVRFIASVFSA
jgi:aryl-alcohol dehydrogenase-like predicted oxidoreductase